MRIYLDLCCLNRPFDDQGQDRIRLEAEAILLVQNEIQAGRQELVTSDVLELKNSGNPDLDRRARVGKTLEMASLRIEADANEVRRGRSLLSLGFGRFDSLHVACAESAQADVLLTTDDHFLSRAQRNAKILAVRVANPVEWIRSQEEDGHHEHKTDDRE